MARLAVILLGPPAAGKGTQAHKIADSLCFPAISTGEILRSAVRRGTDLGIQARRYMDFGELVPDAVVDEIVEERLSLEDCRHGFILDGYPRTIRQAENLEKVLERDPTRTIVIGITVPDEVLIRRVSGRRSCPRCGRVFAAAALPSGEPASCTACGAELVSRRDDSAEVMAERLVVYHRQTQPLIDYYGRRGWYTEVDGNRSADQIERAILEVLSTSQDEIGRSLIER